MINTQLATEHMGKINLHGLKKINMYVYYTTSITKRLRCDHTSIYLQGYYKKVKV